MRFSVGGGGGPERSCPSNCSSQSGSGARFSLFPPENATGNYVKVVQRVPVKILLDDNPDGNVVLGAGMSVEPSSTLLRILVANSARAGWIRSFWLGKNANTKFVKTQTARRKEHCAN
jgi:hypothetical protein